MRTSRSAGADARRRLRRGARLAAAATAALLLLASPAAAGPYLDEVPGRLRAEKVYRDPAAEAEISSAAAGRLRERVDAAGTPMFVAILPEAARQETGGDAAKLATEIARRVEQPGTYMVISGTRYATGNVGGAVATSQAVRLAGEAFAAHRGEPEAALAQWVDGVAAAARGGQAQPAGAAQAQPEEGDGGGAGGTIAAVAVVLLLLVGGGALLFGARRRRAERERQLAEVKTVAQEDLIALGEDIRALDLDTSMPSADPEAARHHADAVASYERAAGILDRARRPEDLAPMSAALEAGRFSMASAKAVLEGRPPPERRPPCFFDPRHGPSVEDVEWTPPGGLPRVVPVCAADAQRLRDGVDPDARQVPAGAGGQRVPYWNAPGYYAPYAGGFFGGFGGMGGLFTGFLLGSALGGWGGYPVSVGGGEGGDGEGGEGDGGDAGDAGGDWGGGDWGGGDFGGGDFGGGDFGGGE
jgi:hypothetical protein